MKSKLGQTLRKIRKSKQVSICAIADKHLSKSQISRFERGESEISCIRLINISLDEFLILHDTEYTQTISFGNLMQYIRKEYSLQNVDNIKSLLTNSTIYQLNSLERTMVKSIIYTLDNKISPSEAELESLTDYLFKVETWGYYEIILLANCIRTIQYNSAFLLTKEMIKNFIYSTLNKTNKKLVTQLAINCLIVSIDKRKFQNCSYLINEIKKLLNNEFNYYEQTVFLYATGYYEFKINNRSGLEKMQQALKVFEILGENSIKSQYQQHYNEHVE